jgi:hypothetical protein
VVNNSNFINVEKNKLHTFKVNSENVRAVFIPYVGKTPNVLVEGEYYIVPFNEYENLRDLFKDIGNVALEAQKECVNKNIDITVLSFDNQYAIVGYPEGTLTYRPR